MPATRINCPIAWFRRAIGWKGTVLGVALLLASGLVRAETEGESVAVFFPKSSEYPGGFVSYGNTVLSKSHGSETITVSNPKAAAFVWWFANHKRLTKQAVADWEKCVLRLDIRPLEGGANVKVSASWRAPGEEGDRAEFSSVSTAGESLESGEWSAVSIPVPDASTMAAEEINGLLVSLEPGGEYEIRKIEVVAVP